MVQRSFQLIVKIFKGEGLDKLHSGSEKYWVHVRTQGCELETHQVNKERVEWHQKLSFPVYWPTYNEKVVLKLMCSSGGYSFLGGTSRQFLANIPEKPSKDDIFNIGELLSLEGKMDPEWWNIYGVR